MSWTLRADPLIEAEYYSCGTDGELQRLRKFIENYTDIVSFDTWGATVTIRCTDGYKYQIEPYSFIIYDEEKHNGFRIMSTSNYDKFVKEIKEEQEKKEEENSMTNMFNGMFGKVAPGMCRISVNGDIAIKTSGGYKTYDVNTGTLTNCDNFVFDMGEDMFFIIPTNKVHIGDIILAGGKPRCVTGVSGNKIETLSFEDGQISTIVPEHHVFMGKQYFYGKIVSMFGTAIKGKGGMGNMMKYMMMSEMMKGKGFGGGEGSNWMQMLPAMALMNGNLGFNFENMFDFGDDEDEEETPKVEEEK